MRTPGAILVAEIDHAVADIITTTNPAVAAVLNARENCSCLVEPFSLDTLVAHVAHYVPLARLGTTN